MLFGSSKVPVRGSSSLNAFGNSAHVQSTVDRVLSLVAGKNDRLRRLARPSNYLER